MSLFGTCQPVAGANSTYAPNTVTGGLISPSSTVAPNTTSSGNVANSTDAPSTVNGGMTSPSSNVTSGSGGKTTYPGMGYSTPYTTPSAKTEIKGTGSGVTSSKTSLNSLLSVGKTDNSIITSLRSGKVTWQEIIG